MQTAEYANANTITSYGPCLNDLGKSRDRLSVIFSGAESGAFKTDIRPDNCLGLRDVTGPPNKPGQANRRLEAEIHGKQLHTFIVYVHCYYRSLWALMHWAKPDTKVCYQALSYTNTPNPTPTPPEISRPVQKFLSPGSRWEVAPKEFRLLGQIIIHLLNILDI